MVSGSREKVAVGVTPWGGNAYRFSVVVLSGGRIKSVKRSEVLQVGDPKGRDKLRALGVGSKVPVVLALSRQEALIKSVRFPAADPRVIARMAPFESVAHAPWPLEESVLSHEIVGTGEDGFSTVLLLMARNEVVREHLAHLREWNVQPVRVEVSVLCLARLLRSAEDQERPALLIAEEDGSTYVRLSDGHYAYSRGAASEEAPAEALRYALETDRRLHTLECTLPTSLTVAGARAEELPRTDVPGLGDVVLRSIEEVTFGVLNGVTAIESSALVCVAAALGAAEDQGGANLLPKKEQSTLVRRRVFRSARRLALLLAWCAGMLAFLVHYSFSTLEARVEKANAAMAALEKTVGNLKEESQSVELLAGERRVVAAPLDIVLALYGRTPTSIALTSLLYDARGTLVLGGEAPGFPAVYEYMEALSKSPTIFRNVEMKFGAKPHGGDAGLAEFKLGCSVGAVEGK